MFTPARLSLLAALSLAATSASAQFFTGLGFTPGTSSSAARGVSADGTVVVGDSGVAFSGTGFRWTAGTGMQSIGTLPGGTYSFIAGISANGQVISGYGDTPSGQRAFRWTSTEMQNLGTLPGGVQSLGGNLSADGSVIACISNTPSGYRAARWTSAGMQSLGTLPGGTNSFAYAASADGSVIVGDSYASLGGDVAFRWTSAGMQRIGTFPGGVFSYAYNVSADGLVVVGDSESFNGDIAYRWTAAGGMQSLGTLATPFDYMVSNGVNADGSVIVGGSVGATNTAFVWTSSLGIVDLNDYLISQHIDLTGWVLTDAAGVSADGTVIVGTGLHNGVEEAWLFDSRPHCGTADFNNDGDSGTDADIEAFFACLAGNCCGTCFSADFNMDGDTGTDADIEAFFRVLGGGSC